MVDPSRWKAAMATAALAAGCGSDVTVEETTATCDLYGVDKASLVGHNLVGETDPPTFTMEVEVLGTDFEGAEPPVFEGSTMTVRFEVLEQYLVARRTADDVPVGAYEIERHVPVVCYMGQCINRSTSGAVWVPPAECHDFVAALASPTPWNARPRFTFGWWKNEVAGELAFDGESQRWPAEGDYHSLGFYVTQGDFVPRFELEDGYFWHADLVYAEIPLEPNACLPENPGPNCLKGTIQLGISYTRQ